MEKSWNFSNETCRIVSEKEERAWFAAFVIEFIVIFILNAFTLATYTRNRHLRKPKIVIGHHKGSELCRAGILRITNSFSTLYLSNSMVNPLIYAVRMQEFTKAARKRFLL